MNTLFIDTHSDEINITIRKKDKNYSLKRTSNHSHSVIATKTLEDVLKSAGIELQDIDQIIVINGPGSFTGVRIGVTIAKTIAYSLNIKIKTITSLEARGVSTNEKFNLITVRDSKGVFSARYVDGSFLNFEYRKNSEFENYVKENNFIVSEYNDLNFENILNYLDKKDYSNPHLVNPIYIKEIDVLK